MITATTQKTQRETHTPPWVAKRYIGLQVRERLLAGTRPGVCPGGWKGMRKLWRWGDEDELVVAMLEMNTSAVYGCPSQRPLSECALTQMHIKEIWVMEIHSYCSH